MWSVRARRAGSRATLWAPHVGRAVTRGMVMAGRWFEFREFRGRRLRVIFVCSVGVQALWITCTMMLHIGRL